MEPEYISPDPTLNDSEVVDLTDKDPRTEKFQRTILMALDPDKYDVNVSDYFLAQAQ